MGKDLLDLYSDYLICQNKYATATGLSRTMDGSISHDQITRFLNQKEFSSKDLWKFVKPEIRKHQHNLSGKMLPKVIFKACFSQLSSIQKGVVMKVQLGDVIEVETSKGFAYVQYTHEDPTYGSIVRVLQGIFETAQLPEKLCEIAQKSHEFIAIIPLVDAVKKKIFKVVAHCEVPAFASQYPTFRTARGAYKRFVLYDGNEKRRKEDLSPEEKKFPILRIWNDTLLAERYSGWQKLDTK